jgi:2-polyprenyl-6-hydroxyphenyl methylase/3-demethylubiquinone-9 3-methyltransferase
MSGGDKRFWFGRNWHGFVKRNFTPERCEVAKKRVLDFVGRPNLEGVDFLDIGCGSGIHSYAVWQSGAKHVHSFDYDPNSVEATRYLWNLAGRPANWSIERGDALDKDYIARLGKWSFVYSWGVLHHTGAMWDAVRNAQSTVADGGQFYLALYSSDVQPQAQMWLDVKKDYVNTNFFGRRRWEAWYIWNYMMGKDMKKLPDVLKRMAEYKFNRGMDLMTDIRDWLGGWPMEFAGDQETVDLLEGECGFRLTNASTGEACTEFLFKRSGAPTPRTNIKDFVAAKKAALPQAA